MKKFNSISEWLKTNPSKEEQNKVLLLIQRGETNKTRRSLYEKEYYIRKLMVSANSLTKLGIPIPADITKAINETKVEVEKLKKDLPEVVKKVKKEEPKVEDPKSETPVTE